MSTWNQWEWSPEIDFQSRSGLVLKKFCEAISTSADYREIYINLFGSAPLELGLHIALNSNDIDIEPDHFYIEIQKKVKEAHLGIGKSIPYIQVAHPGVFKAARSWVNRSETRSIHGIQLRFAHPIDIIIGKLFRLETKDFEGIDRIIQEVGRPTRDDFLFYLNHHPDIFSFRHEMVKKFCDNLEVYSTYRSWELIPANQLFAHYLKITNQIYSEGEKTSHRLQEAFGEDSIDQFS